MLGADGAPARRRVTWHMVAFRMCHAMRTWRPKIVHDCCSSRCQLTAQPVVSVQWLWDRYESRLQDMMRSLRARARVRTSESEMNLQSREGTRPAAGFAVRGLGPLGRRFQTLLKESSSVCGHCTSVIGRWVMAPSSTTGTGATLRFATNRASPQPGSSLVPNPISDEISMGISESVNFVTPGRARAAARVAQSARTRTLRPPPSSSRAGWCRHRAIL